jgi:16S rRNA U516 pseudouridylate synthase RsuA-like enzyme
VVSLRRIAFGSLRLGRLPGGGSRRLGDDELRGLWEDSRLDSE